MLCDDLIFFSRVEVVAKNAGLSIRQAKTTAAALDLARSHPPGGVIVDLQNETLDLVAFLANLREICAEMPRIVAFGSHVEAATLHAARVAGCDRVLPRSRFVEELLTDLPEWLTPVIPLPPE